MKGARKVVSAVNKRASLRSSVKKGTRDVRDAANADNQSRRDVRAEKAGRREGPGKCDGEAAGSGVGGSSSPSSDDPSAAEAVDAGRGKVGRKGKKDAFKIAQTVLPAAADRTLELKRRVDALILPKSKRREGSAGASKEQGARVRDVVGPSSTTMLTNDPGDDVALRSVAGKRKVAIDERDIEGVTKYLKSMEKKRKTEQTKPLFTPEVRGRASTISKGGKRDALGGQARKQTTRGKKALRPSTCVESQVTPSPKVSTRKKKTDGCAANPAKRPERTGNEKGNPSRKEKCIVRPMRYLPAVDMELRNGGISGTAFGMEQSLIVHRFKFESKRGTNGRDGMAQKAMAVFVQSHSRAAIAPRGFSEDGIGVARLNFTGAAMADAEKMAVGDVVRMSFAGSTMVEPQAAEYRTFVNENRQIYSREKLVELSCKKSWDGVDNDVVVQRVALESHEIRSEEDLKAVLKQPPGKRYVSMDCHLASEPPLPRSFGKRDQKFG